MTIQPFHTYLEPLEPRIAPAFAAVLELSSLTGLNGFKLQGAAGGDYSGSAISSAGDINGDGFDDLLIGAFQADPNGSSASGASYVVFGKASGFPAAVDLAALNGADGFQLFGEATGDYSGNAVSSAGDVNGDGFDDLVIGARRADPNGPDSGAAYVVFGKAAGFAPALSLASLDGTNGFKMNGEAASDFFGRFVSGAGDVNGDGFDDLIISADGADPNGNSASGSGYVVFGKGGAFSPLLNPSALDGTDGFRINGVVANDKLGSSVSGAGDVNGDGFDDLLIGAFLADPNGTDSGTGYVVFGKASGFSAALNLSTLNGTNGFQIDGENGMDFAGIAISGAGDINGDGFDDVLIGAFGADPNGKASSGASYVVYGKAAGFASTLNVATLDGSNGFRIAGEVAGDYSGSSVAGVGDVNGDGIDDLLIGAFRASPGNSSGSGASYVVFGKAAAFPATFNLSALTGPNGFQINGEASGDRSGNAVNAAGDVNGDGFADLLIGAYGADAKRGATYVIFGQGADNANLTLQGKRKATFTDVDGDRVTIKVSKGTLKLEDFTLARSGEGLQLDRVDFSGESEFAGANLSITAKRAPNSSGGDGSVNVGHVDVAGIDFGKVRVKGDLGQIDAGDSSTPERGLVSLSAKTLGIAGGVSQQSDVVGTLKTLKLTALRDGTLVVGEELNSATIKGDVIGAAILSNGKIGSLKIGGDLAASSTRATTISAAGIASPSSEREARAIGSIAVGGSVDHAQILAGYNVALAPTNADVAIGRILVGGSWTASSVAAGVSDTSDDGFGRNDSVISGGATPLAARIASIIIKGTATGSTVADDHFGITAEEIGKAKIEGVAIPLTESKDNVLLDDANGDFRIREV